MKISHYYPHSGGILGCHANVDFQHTNYLLNVTICEKLGCAHKLQTISDAFSHIASRFLKVALAIKFALNCLAGPQCAGLRKWLLARYLLNDCENSMLYYPYHKLRYSRCLSTKFTFLLRLQSLNPRPTGGGLFRAPPLWFSCDIF